MFKQAGLGLAYAQPKSLLLQTSSLSAFVSRIVVNWPTDVAQGALEIGNLVIGSKTEFYFELCCNIVFHLRGIWIGRLSGMHHMKYALALRNQA